MKGNPKRNMGISFMGEMEHVKRKKKLPVALSLN